MAESKAPAIRDWIADLGFYDLPAVAGRRKVLVYGESGAGKTHLLGTFPDPFVIDSDGGGLTLAALHIPFVPIKRGEKCFERVMDILRCLQRREPPFDNPNLPVQTIGFDSLTAMADCFLVEAMLYPGPEKAPRDPTKQKPEWDDYSAVQARMKTAIKFAEDLGLHVVATAGVKLERDEVLGTFIGKPNIVGSYRDVVAHDFDEEYYLEAVTAQGKTTYKLYTSKVKYYEAKSRAKVKSCDDPTYLTLYPKPKEKDITP